ncbi:hypothetical protein QAC21B_01213 [Acinetobacter bohemicus]|nr:hypothetical protein QAC21B_01213 [Acinetobacter bohemicus]
MRKLKAMQIKDRFLSNQVVNSTLRYSTLAPLIDSLMNELGIQDGDIKGLTQRLKPQSTSAK